MTANKMNVAECTNKKKLVTKVLVLAIIFKTVLLLVFLTSLPITTKTGQS